MTRVICDICGAEISLDDRMGASERSRIHCIVGDKYDICPECERIGSEMNPVNILMQEWTKEAIRQRMEHVACQT